MRTPVAVKLSKREIPSDFLFHLQNRKEMKVPLYALTAGPKSKGEYFVACIGIKRLILSPFAPNIADQAVDEISLGDNEHLQHLQKISQLAYPLLGMEHVKWFLWRFCA